MDGKAETKQHLRVQDSIRLKYSWVNEKSNFIFPLLFFFGTERNSIGYQIETSSFLYRDVYRFDGLLKAIHLLISSSQTSQKINFRFSKLRGSGQNTIVIFIIPLLIMLYLLCLCICHVYSMTIIYNFTHVMYLFSQYCNSMLYKPYTFIHKSPVI